MSYHARKLKSPAPRKPTQSEKPSSLLPPIPIPELLPIPMKEAIIKEDHKEFRKGSMYIYDGTVRHDNETFTVMRDGFGRKHEIPSKYVKVE